MTAGRTEQQWIGRKTVLGLGHANGEMPVAFLLELCKLGTNLFIGNDVLGTIHGACNTASLFPQAQIIAVKSTKL